MFNEKDILARLANGESADVIANEFAAMLNKALEDQRKVQEKEKIAARKREIAEVMGAGLMEYISLVNPDLGAYMADSDIDYTEIMLESMDAMADLIKSISLTQYVAETPTCDRKDDQPRILHGDEAINAFLEMFGL